MPLLAIPNISEGRRPEVVASLRRAVAAGGGTILDEHLDPVHNRMVLTVIGDLPEAMAALATAAVEQIDLTTHAGVHPRLGVFDVCPIVPHGAPMEEAVEVAWRTGDLIADRSGIPVYFYGHAAPRAETRALPDLRVGGLSGLERRLELGFLPDLGQGPIDPRRGVTCVGARGPLIAFNVWLRCTLDTARAIAAAVRTSGGGPPGIRALGLPIEEPDIMQVSMNLVDPTIMGIDDAFDAVMGAAVVEGAEITATEIVGLVEERFLPDPNKQAARLLMAPGRSIESTLPS